MKRIAPNAKYPRLSAGNVRLMYFFYTDDPSFMEQQQYILDTRGGWLISNAATGETRFDSYGNMAQKVDDPARKQYDRYHEFMMQNPVVTLKAGDAVKGNVPDHVHETYLRNANNWFKGLAPKLNPPPAAIAPTRESVSQATTNRVRDTLSSQPVPVNAMPYPRENR